MFDNIGKKIKDFSVFLTWIGIIASIIIGLIFIFHEDFDNSIGVLIIILGSLVSWISFWLLYGFGEIVENTSIIAQKVAPENFQDHQEPTKPKTSTPTNDKDKISPGAIVLAVVSSILFIIFIVVITNMF